MISKTRRLLMLGLMLFPVHGALARNKADKLDLSGFTDTLFADVSYASAQSDVMDIYVPKNAVSPPLVLWVHGGAFWGGDKRDQSSLARALPDMMAAGIAVAAPNYRLSGEAVWPAQREDLATALAYLRDHAAEYGYDPQRLAVFGTSAGATLALIAGLDEAVSGRTALKAIAAWFPATLFTEMDADMALDVPVPASEAMTRRGSMISRLIGTPLGRDAQPALQASPVTLLAAIPESQPLPPFLLAAGADDRTISWRQSQRMADALRARTPAPPVDFQIYPDSGHGSGAFQGEAVGKLVQFLTDRLLSQ